MKYLRPLKLIGTVFSIMGAAYILIGVILYKAISNEGEAFVGSIVFAALGGSFLLLGLVFVIADAARISREKALVENGEMITATVVRLEKNPNYNNGAISPSVLVCLYSEGGVDYVYKSGLIKGTPILNAETVPVYIDRTRPHSYFVDAKQAIKDTVEL